MPVSSKLILVTGGARSGKSAYALSLERPGMRKAFLATCEPLDEEMRSKVARHRAQRSADWVTIEEPLEIETSLHALEGRFDLVVVDCLTLWLNNLLMHGASTEEVLRKTDLVLASARAVKGWVVFVSNEIGMGIVPADAMVRVFRDLAGAVNQRVAQEADEVYFLVAGLPVVVKRG
ncbi:MAG: bifunctional adenosylcobinamide kinase/adenosylcobinamide-phosphate guanylyltransferase [Nitrospirae bacterium]|nr:bifunctional adenosylcobinamide kinase/adenosylcobinamide-phosphate guanylyltransferase [Nitrospirota bacterium]